MTLVSYGICINDALDAAAELSKLGVSAEVIKLNRVCPLDGEKILLSAAKTGVLVTVEDVCRPGCVGEQLLALCGAAGILLRGAKCMNLGGGILENGAPVDLKKKIGLDGSGIARAVMEMLHEKDKA